MKRHSVDEIASKLRHADELMARGQSQAQACRALGVSVMTFHRWRKQRPSRGTEQVHSTELPVEAGLAQKIPGVGDWDTERVKELRLENDRLRKIVTDLLLEKMQIEEQLSLETSGRARQRRT